MRFGCVCLFLGRFDPFPWQLLLFWAPSRLLDVFITFVASLRQSIFNKRPSHFGDTHSKALALCYARLLESFRLKPTILLHCTVYAVLWRWSLLLWWSFVFRPAKIGRYSNFSANQIWVKRTTVLRTTYSDFSSVWLQHTNCNAAAAFHIPHPHRMAKLIR